MKKRLYFLLPNLTSAIKTADDLLLARVDDRHMRFIAKRGTDLGVLHQAGILQKTDNVHGAFLGMMGGGIAGLLVGCAMYWLQPLGLHISLMVVLALTLCGTLFGLWTGSMVGASVPNSHLRQFQNAFEQGYILAMVDVARERVAEIERLINGRHPEAEYRGVEPMIPAFP